MSFLEMLKILCVILQQIIKCTNDAEQIIVIPCTLDKSN